MNLIPVNNYTQLKDELGGSPNCGEYYFRGVKSCYEIIPSICYNSVSKTISSTTQLKEYELCLINRFEQCLRINHNITRYNIDDWDLWFMARHFGLNSRLIDLSKQITIVLQFAFEMSCKSPAHLFCLNRNCLPNYIQSDFQANPFLLNTSCIIQPSLQYNALIDNIGIRRQFIQASKFLYQSLETINKPLTTQYHSDLWKLFEIQPSDFEKIKKTLF